MVSEHRNLVVNIWFDGRESGKSSIFVVYFKM